MSVSPVNAGNVLADGVQLMRSPSFYSLYPDEDITLEAVPTFNYRFDYWSQETPSTGESQVYATESVLSLSSGDDRWLTAHFAPIVPYWLMAVIAAAIVVPLVIRWQLRRRWG